MKIVSSIKQIQGCAITKSAISVKFKVFLMFVTWIITVKTVKIDEW